MASTQQLAAVITCLAILSAISCSRARQVQASSDEGQLSTVAVAKVTLANLSHSVTLTAEFKPFQEVDVMAKVSGYVKEIYVDVGDRVRPGHLLAILEIPEMASDIARSQANLQRSQADVSRAKDELARAQAAHEMNHLGFDRLESVSKARPGLVAQQEIDDAHSRDLQGEAVIAAARSALVSAEEQVRVAQAESAKIRTMFEYTRVTAPFAGVITKRYAHTGSMIQAGTGSTTQVLPLVRLSENGLLRLIVPVPESQVPLVKIGKPVEVNVPTLHRVFAGKIARFSDVLQLSTRTMDTEVDVPNPELVIIPGMYAEVNLPLSESRHALAVPVEALAGSEEKRAVFVVNKSGRIEEAPVSVGIETARRAEIKSGLQEGDLVVVGNRAQLKTGQQVIPKVVDMSGDKGGS